MRVDIRTMRFTAASLVTLCSLLATSASAQTPGQTSAEASDDGLFEIIVTAQKREENLQVVPISVSAFTSENIVERSLQNIGEVANFTPNVVRGSGPSTNDDGFLFFRGVGQLDNNGNVEPGVGVYVDEVYLGRVQGASLDAMDVERIEVLRGPQGTLFGRNTIGGALSVTTRDPGDELTGQARVIVGDRSHIDVLGSMDVPISDGLGLALSAFSRNQDGWADNRDTGDTYGDRQDLGGRAKLVWDASEVLEVKFTADWNDSEGTVLPTVLLAATPGASSPLSIPFPDDFATEVDTSPFDDSVSGSIDPDIDSKRGGGGLQVTWDLGEVQLKSITAFRKMDQQVQADLDGSAYSFYDFQFIVDQDQWSQELQFSGSTNRVQWLAGLYYYHEELLNHTTAGVGTNTGGAVVGPPPPFPPPPAPQIPIGSFLPADRLDGRSLDFLSDYNQDTDSYAAFGQVTFSITEALSTTLGLRYTKDEKDLDLKGYSDNTDSVFSPACYATPFPLCAPDAPVGLLLPTSSVQTSDSWDETTPKVGLEYQITDDVMVYASWSNGFKAGGFQGRATPGNTAPSFDPETLEAYEVGVKSQFLDNRIRVNAATFFTKYDDVQMLVFSPADTSFITSNAGDNEVKGLELEIAFAPIDGLDLNASAGWLDTEWQTLDPTAASFGITEEDDLAYSPDLTLAFGAQYRWDLGGRGALAVRADYNWRDDFYFQAANNPNDLQDAYGLLDLRATWFSPDDQFSVAAYGRNVTDEEYYGNLSDQRFGAMPLGVSLATLAPPRDYGLEFAYRFGN